MTRTIARKIDGIAVSKQVKDKVKSEIEQRIAKGFRQPGLAVIIVGDDAASHVYVSHKKKACEVAGIRSMAYDLPAVTTQQELMDLVSELNNNSDIDGILVQLPLPEHIETEDIIEHIATHKDVDGFHPYNIGRLVARIPTLRSCTPYGVMKLLESIGEPIKSKHAVIVGASNHVGRPMGLELLLAGATVTTCHRFTPNLVEFVSQADILVVGVGKPGLIKGEWIKPGAIVIDIGMNRLANGKLTGDVEHDAAAERAAWITPVPGGVGPMTVAMLMENTLYANKTYHEPDV